MLTSKEANKKKCLQKPEFSCMANECMGWMPAARNKPDNEGDYGQCIHHLGMQALMNASAVFMAGDKRVIH